MKTLLFLFLIALTGVSATAQADLSASCTLFKGNSVSDGGLIPLNGYQVKFRSCQISGQNWVGIREFNSQNRTFVLLTEPNSFKTQIADLSCLKCNDIKLNEISNSVYKQAITEELSTPFPLSNKGITHSKLNAGLFLTMDLCPSHKDFDYSVFENEKVKARSEFPIAVAISGGWMSRHERELQWMKNQVLNRQLDIVWVNHSYTHPYKKGVPNKDNFLLGPNINFSDEVLKQEQYMISNGLTPSVFFRFPGLISNESLIRQLGQFGLLSLGSDAWLALDQRPTPGSVILVHGNGNEEIGIRLLHKLIDGIADMGIFKNLNQVLQSVPN